jgi:hypothetical protein
MELDAEQIVAALLNHENELVRMATHNAILQAQVQALLIGGQADAGLDLAVESGAEAEPDGEDA